MEGPGAWGCDTLLPGGQERPAVECDPVAHHVGHTSITEQTDGRAMDAQPKPNRRLVPGHLTAAEHVITSVSGDKPGTSWAVFIGASGGCQRLLALVAPGEGTPSGRHPRHSEAAD
jgi:hypothetical protein